MLFDAGSFVPTPGCGGGGNAIGEEAVDDAGQKISQVLSIAGDGNDLVPMRLVSMKALTRSSAYTNPATTPRRNFCFAKVSSICSIVWKGYRPLAPLGRIKTSVSVRYGFEKYAYRLRASLAVAPAAMSAVPAESAARWSSQAISGRRISTLMIRASARSISTSKPVRIGTSRL